MISLVSEDLTNNQEEKVTKYCIIINFVIIRMSFINGCSKHSRTGRHKTRCQMTKCLLWCAVGLCAELLFLLLLGSFKVQQLGLLSVIVI